uniref:LOW QUALITY PROTEIN: 5-azacytidine-induced protein 2-like n=1 Tax=Jaculus jaculus TaxID=51337 RepID=UPI001E1B4651|nr:LOW QUALITY PROTEIN: 5-azacytidine-induced protein 2-like [Jaculus jaculus]
MDTLVEDDICILNHEKAHRGDTLTPLSIYTGDESVASHFALVTAYEDIKKRLKDSEKENSFLKKRIRVLEERLAGTRSDEETSSVGREQVNKAYHAYREVCIDRDNLKSKLDKMYSVEHAYWELKREMSNLHLVTQVQAELLKKLKTPAAVKKACASVACVEDLGKDSTKLHLTNFTAMYKRHPPLSPNGKAICYTPSSPLPGDIKVLSEKAILQSWTDNERSIPNDGADFQEHNSYGRNSLEDNSWVFPSPPKSSDTAFGEAKSKTFPVPILPPLHYLDQHNQNCLYKN